MQSAECWQKAMMVLIIASSMVLRIRLGFPVKRYFQTPEIDIIVISDDDWWMNYPGGKGKCYQRLINLMPAHQVYIETHLGAGAVMRHKKPASRSIGVDIDPAVHALWQQPQLKERCEFVQADALQFLQAYPFTGQELIYADPPYLSETRQRSKVYRFEYDIAGHVELLTALKLLPCMVMISGYRSDLYGQELEGWRLVSFDAKTHSSMREECVWMNFPAPEKLHDTCFWGHTYRERQTIARRQARLRQKIALMNPIERNDLIQWMNETYGRE
ncbi:DNA adenine methylase [Pseudomonas baetica]|uniref:DNA adenine methylase n=1 Tax=Pseudomonas baetica TaxID=674054 RepID=UPI003EEB6C2B